MPDLWLSRSSTTVPAGRRPADAYVFVDRATFDADRDGGGFLEWADVFGNLYGTPGPHPPAGHDLLLEIDVQGAAQVKRPATPTSVVFFVGPVPGGPGGAAAGPGRRRGRDRPPAGLAAPRSSGRALADHVVVNDDLDRAIEEVAAILECRGRGQFRSRPPEWRPERFACLNAPR